MAIKVVCVCKRSRLFPDGSEGQTAVCRKCGATLTVTGEKVVAPKVSPFRRWLPVLLVLAIPSVVGVAFWRTRQPRFTSAMEEYKDGSRAKIDPAIDGPRIERLFATLAAASKDGDEPAFGACFHGRRMLAEIESRGGIDAVGMRRDETALEEDVYATARDWCEQMRNSDSAWQAVHRCSFKFVEPRGEAEAAVVLRGKDHSERLRFWLVKENDAWFIYDYESLESAFRFSTHNGRLLVRQARKEFSGHRLDEVSGLVDKATNLMVRNMVEEALRVLQEAETRAPGPLMPSVEFSMAMALYRLGREEEALKKIDSALQHQKDFPVALQFRGVILHALRRHEECIRAEADFMKIVGDDAGAWFWTGMALEGLGRKDDAVQAYRKGAACDDTESQNRKRLQSLGLVEK